MRVGDGYRRIQLPCECLDYTGPKARHGCFSIVRKSHAVVFHSQGPTRLGRAVIEDDPPVAMPAWKGVIERIDEQFGCDQAKTNRKARSEERRGGKEWVRT